MSLLCAVERVRLLGRRKVGGPCERPATATLAYWRPTGRFSEPRGTCASCARKERARLGEKFVQVALLEESPTVPSGPGR